MTRFTRTIGIIGVLLMLLSSMGAAVYAQEDGVAAPLEPAGTGDSGNVGAGDVPATDGSAADPAASGSAPPAEVSEEAPDGPASEPADPLTPGDETEPAGAPAGDPAAPDDTIPPPSNDAAATDPGGDAPEGDGPVVSTQAEGASVQSAQQSPGESAETQAIDVGEPDGDASVALEGLALSCDGVVTFSTVVAVTYERFEGHLIIDIYEGNPAAGGTLMTTVFPSQGEALLGGTTAYAEDLGWSTSILANPHAHVRWTLTAWNGPDGMDYVGEWRGSESAGLSGGCADPGDGDPTDPGDGDPSNPGDAPSPDDGITSIDAGCDGVLTIEAGTSIEILAVATANGSGVGAMWRFSAVPGEHTHDFWADDDPAATADDVVFAVYEINEYDEPLYTYFTTLSCSGKPFYDVEQFDLTCEGVLTVAYGERSPEFPLYTLYDGETGEQLGSSRSFHGTDFGIEPGVHDSLYVVGEDNWPTLPVYLIAEATVTGCLGNDPDPDPDTGQIALSLSLEDASGAPDTSADGATASWTVEAAGSFATNPSVNGLKAGQPAAHTAVVTDGVASTVTGPLPLGIYQVCLDDTLTGGPDGDVSIADAPICDTVELTEAGATPAGAGFVASIQDGTTDPGPADGGTPPNVVSVSIDSPNACAFVGGSATVTGTSQVDGIVGPSVRADLIVGWEAPTGTVEFGRAHQGPGSSWADRPLEVNGPWSITKSAWDPVIGGKDVGGTRPAGATTLFVTLELRERLTAEPDATLTARYSLADCGDSGDTDPGETGQIDLMLTLTDASGDPDPSADGATATWSVEPVGSVAGNPNVNGFRAARSATAYTAVLVGGVATTTTSPLPIGAYEVCLSATLTGRPNGEVSIGDAPMCDTVELTEAGASAPVASGFTASIQGAGAGAGEAPGPSDPATTGMEGQSAPTASAQASSATGAGTSEASSGRLATALPVTGAGPTDGGGGALTLPWLLLASGIFAAAGVAIRRRSPA